MKYTIELNVVNEIYYRLWNHNWSRWGYDNYAPLGILTFIVNRIVVVIVAIFLLYLYFTKW